VAVAPELVATGLAASLARPGGSVTGLTDQVIEFAGEEIRSARRSLG
jgi:hypothetical protein